MEELWDSTPEAGDARGQTLAGFALRDQKEVRDGDHPETETADSSLLFVQPMLQLQKENTVSVVD